MKRLSLTLGLACIGFGLITRAQDISSSGLYQEPLRPQYHFSARQGWLNDPNGLVYFQGQYHLFFQHTPDSRQSGLKSWGHAVSADLVHWTEIAEALSPDEAGSIWSGSAVVDWQNSSGFGQDGKPPLVLIYTCAPEHHESHGRTSLAYSTDGVHFTKYDGNPVVDDMGRTNRDPKVFWYAPGKFWVLALYVEENDHHNIRFFHSTDLKRWTIASQFEGGKIGRNGQPSDNFLYECPDFWEMPVETNSNNKHWILTAGNTEYVIGNFDGTTFKSVQLPRIEGQRGVGYYAPQTFNEEPQGRRIRIGWLQTDAPGMPFTQSMSLPSELNLIRAVEGNRLTWSPVKELETLRGQTYLTGPRTVAPGDANLLANVDTDLLEIRAEWTPAQTNKTTFLIRGIPVSYDASKSELTVRDRHIYTPRVRGKMNFIIYADRLSLEVYASDGWTYIPLPVDFPADNRSTKLTVEGEPVTFDKLDVYELKSAWTK